jgi:hypothetical protein
MTSEVGKNHSIKQEKHSRTEGNDEIGDDLEG